MINIELGEWRQLLKKHGEVIVGDLGNPWKPSINMEGLFWDKSTDWKNRFY
jgi:hypothetical protein